MLEQIQLMLDETRIDAEPVIVSDTGTDAIIQNSSDATLVLLPFRILDIQLVDPFGGKIESLLEKLPVSALVLAAEDIDLSAEPEEGTQAEQAAVHDAADNAVKKAIKAQKAALEKANKLSEKTAQSQETEVADNADKELEKLEKETVEAEKKAAKAAVKAKDAIKEAEKLNGLDKKDNM